MTCSAVIIENRFPVDAIMDAHAKFLPPDWAIVHIQQPINTIQQYNEFLVSRDFWEAMTDHVLIFQHDSGLLRKGIENFLQWDFIGAPVKWMSGYFNGGLSLRNRDMMLRVIDQIEYMGQNEDLYFVDGIRRLGGKLPDIETAMEFSVETMYYEKPLGFHAMNKYLTEQECQTILKSA